MAFSDTQIRKLQAKLDAEHVRTRSQNGVGLSYIEGWYAIAEANRIFGFDGWDRRTISADCVWTAVKGGHFCAAYIAKVRINVRAGDAIIVREGSGTGEAIAETPGQAHDAALKTAETDATKRALATFGNPFGLALYDRDQAGVRHAKTGKQTATSVLTAPLVLRSHLGKPQRSFSDLTAFEKALETALSQATDVETLFDIWEHNVDMVRAIQKQVTAGAKTTLTKTLVSHFKTRAIALGRGYSPVDRWTDLAKSEPASGANTKAPTQENADQASSIDKSVLALAEPKRIRSKEHLRYVASQPCLICGRQPAQAHHVRYAQPQAMARKVSDEFTVPLCAIHHGQNHTRGDERSWWRQHKIDPLPIAAKLWDDRLKSSNLQTASPIEKTDQAARPVGSARDVSG